MTAMLAMCVPYPQRLDTAAYQTIIKDDDPESPVRTKTSLLTREAHPSGSRVVNLGGPRCRPPTLSCAKLHATTAFLTIHLNLPCILCPLRSVLYPVSSCSRVAWLNTGTSYGLHATLRFSWSQQPKAPNLEISANISDSFLFVQSSHPP